MQRFVAFKAVGRVWLRSAKQGCYVALKDLLVHVDQSEHAFERLRLAAALAHRHSSRLTALFVRELNPVQRHQQSIAELGQCSSDAITRTGPCFMGSSRNGDFNEA
jgi:K+-sensing histidine kinase KdpD